MSASSKKKLRNAADAAKLTERQLAEQKEAKKVKLYTIAFAVTLVALLAIAVTIGVKQTISNSGMREKNTVAMTVDGTQLSNAELNYFYIDSLNTFYSQNGSYAALLGLDISKPLNEQVINEETGETWADNFVASAKSSATSVYALCAKAAEAGHTLTEEEQKSLDSVIANAELYASIYGFGNVKDYLKAMYGNGATLEGYRSYVEKSMLAESYQNAYKDSLTYTDDDLRSAEADNFNQYSSFTYNYYYLAASRFLEGGTTDENGSTTYTDEETAASVAAAEEAAKTLTAGTILTAADLDAAIAGLSINADSEGAASTRQENQGYNSITAVMAQWLENSSRKEGDLTYLANTSTDSEGNEVVSGYYVVRFESVNDNTFALKNVRHILVGFEGGVTDENGNTTYANEEKLAAMAAAEQILDEWKAGEATEASFAGLAAEKTTDTASAANGGLYENIYPGQMVSAFNNWCFDESRKAGDTGIVETEYGCHVMYFVGDSDETYRDYQIRNELTNNDVSEWYNGIVEAAEVTDGDTKYLSLDMVLGG